MELHRVYIFTFMERGELLLQELSELLSLLFVEHSKINLLRFTHVKYIRGYQINTKMRSSNGNHINQIDTIPTHFMSKICTDKQALQIETMQSKSNNVII